MNSKDDFLIQNGDTYGQGTIQKALTSGVQVKGIAKEKSLNAPTQNTQGGMEKPGYDKSDKESIKPRGFSADELMKFDFDVRPQYLH